MQYDATGRINFDPDPESEIIPAIHTNSNDTLANPNTQWKPLGRSQMNGHFAFHKTVYSEHRVNQPPVLLSEWEVEIFVSVPLTRWLVNQGLRQARDLWGRPAENVSCTAYVSLCRGIQSLRTSTEGLGGLGFTRDIRRDGVDTFTFTLPGGLAGHRERKKERRAKERAEKAATAARVNEKNTQPPVIETIPILTPEQLGALHERLRQQEANVARLKEQDRVQEERRAHIARLVSLNDGLT
jgi:hypothetical protein